MKLSFTRQNAHTDLQQNNRFKNFFFQVVDDNAKIVSE